MEYSVIKEESYTIIEIGEEKLDTLKAPQLKSEFINQYQSDTVNLILDMSKVKYVDSSGLSSILVANRMSNEVGGKLLIVGISDHVMKLIKISRLDSIFNLHDTKEEAIATISAS